MKRIFQAASTSAFYIFFFVLCWLFAVSNDAVATEQPTLLFLQLGQDSKSREDEKQFLTALQLQLDRYNVVSASVQINGFESAPPEIVVEQLYPIVADKQTHGVIWLSRNESNVMTLHVAAIEWNRATIRLFRQPWNENAAKELALTAAELFESAHLSALDPQLDASPAASQKGSITNGSLNNDASSFQRGLAGLYAGVWGTGALAGHNGPSIRFGGNGGVLWNITPHIDFAFGAGAGYGPLGKSLGYRLDGWNLAGDAAILLLSGDSSVRVGPLLGVSAGVQTVRVSNNDVSLRYRYPVAEAKLAFYVSKRLVKVSVSLSAGLFISPYRTEIVPDATGDILYRNQALGWFVLQNWTFF